MRSNSRWRGPHQLRLVRLYWKITHFNTVDALLEFSSCHEPEYNAVPKQPCFAYAIHFKADFFFFAWRDHNYRSSRSSERTSMDMYYLFIANQRMPLTASNEWLQDGMEAVYCAFNISRVFSILQSTVQALGCPTVSPCHSPQLAKRTRYKGMRNAHDEKPKLHFRTSNSHIAIQWELCPLELEVYLQIQSHNLSSRHHCTRPRIDGTSWTCCAQISLHSRTHRFWDRLNFSHCVYWQSF